MAGEWYAPTLAMFDTAEEVARIYLESVADRLEAQELIISTAMSVGPVATCIVQYAEANKVDLIAMCTHGRTGLARWALGSVADRVLRAGTTPILLVRAQ
jgi:nucleotide-binding universal stress UspA family protein